MVQTRWLQRNVTTAITITITTTITITNTTVY